MKVLNLANANVTITPQVDEFGVETIAVATAKPAPPEPGMAPGIKLTVNQAKSGSGAAPSTGKLHHPSTIAGNSDYPQKLLLTMYELHAKDSAGNFAVSDAKLLSVKKTLMKIWGYPKDALAGDGSNLKIGTAPDNPASAISNDGVIHFTLDGMPHRVDI